MSYPQPKFTVTLPLVMVTLVKQGGRFTVTLGGVMVNLPRVRVSLGVGSPRATGSAHSELLTVSSLVTSSVTNQRTTRPHCDAARARCPVDISSLLSRQVTA